ncbi:LpqB family beta-propeller domain-containing protein [Actinoplanes sp. RD1]|uniref:LpqB family beta-propeller domain-containing protein n=1 Tax=Actinoplanes sp. RD1 TaxID=3064538 RepID=UPI002741DF1C|nr:LpqB family beta-propeller domain-containing protein [Actinoplanes sp. RD1]
MSLEEEVVRSAARAAGPYIGSIDGIHRRARQRRTRRQALAACAAVVALLVGLGVTLNRRNTAAPPAVRPSVSATPEQRLILNGATGAYRTGTMLVELGPVNYAELLPDGRIAEHDLVRVSESAQVSALPGGGVVLLGPVPGGSGPELAVVGPDGKLRLRRDLHANGKTVTLTAASETTAFFQRGDSLFAHELATGAERLILKTRIGGTMAAAADAIGRRLAQAYVFDPCGIEVATAGMASAYSLAASLRRAPDGCTKILALRWSPDGSRLAVAEESDQGRRVVVLDMMTDGGAKISEQPLPGTYQELGAQFDKTDVSLAWQDGRTLRAALYPTGPGYLTVKPFIVGVP